MTKIHWSAYIILGAAVLAASYKIDSQKFKLFIWLGYLFLITGIAKMGIWFINRKKESPKEKMDMRREIYPQRQHQMNQQRAVQNRAAAYCIRCGNQLIGHENFCSRCGQQLRRF